MPLRISTFSPILQFPGRILTVMLLVVFGVEVLVMLALPYIVPREISGTYQALLDAGLLTLACAPVLWWLIVGPLRRIAVQEHVRSETIVTNAGEGILTLSGRGLVTSANRAALALFRMEAEELIGSSVVAVIPDLHLEPRPDARQIKIYGRRPDGQEFPLLVSLSDYPADHGVVYIAILQDLTEVERREAQQVQVAREREALRAQQMTTLAELSTGVAHEIRNPLTSIKMLIQSNRDKFARSGLPTGQLELIIQEIHRMERSINSLLEYGRPEQSEIREFVLQQVLEKTLLLIGGRCVEAGVQVELRVPETPVHLTGDPAQIQQLLLNLSLNALDAMPGGGTLTFKVRLIPGEVRVTVEDTGSGIERQVLDRLFSPFVTTKPSGVGLGLGICRRIAESHQGSLEGRNRPEGGACFELMLPTDQRSAREPGDAETADS